MKKLVLLKAEVPALEKGLEGVLRGGFCSLRAVVPSESSHNTICSNNYTCNTNYTCSSNSTCHNNYSCSSNSTCSGGYYPRH